MTIDDAALLCYEQLFEEPYEENADPDRAVLPPDIVRHGRSYTSRNHTQDEATAWQLGLPPINTTPDSLGLVFE